MTYAEHIDCQPQERLRIDLRPVHRAQLEAVCTSVAVALERADRLPQVRRARDRAEVERLGALVADALARLP